MYVILLDQHNEHFKLKYMTAIHARLAGNEDIEIPDPGEDRVTWEEWLMSELPKEALRTKDEDIIYAALFPDNRFGLTTREVEGKRSGTSADKLRQAFAEANQALTEEVG